MERGGPLLVSRTYYDRSTRTCIRAQRPVSEPVMERAATWRQRAHPFRVISGLNRHVSLQLDLFGTSGCCSTGTSPSSSLASLVA